MNRPLLYQVYPTDTYEVYLYYDNGEIRIYNCSFILERKGVFEQIHDVNRFKELCSIMNGTLAFDISGKFDPYNCIDFCPDTIYEESIVSLQDVLSA